MNKIFSYSLIGLISLLFAPTSKLLAQMSNDCSAAPSIPLVGGNYLNQTLTVPGAFTLSALGNPACVTTPLRDGWVRFQTTQRVRVNIEYTPTSGQDALLAVYSGCNVANILRCSNTQGANSTESLSFTSDNGNNTYYIQLINLTNVADMNGQLTVYQGERRLGDLCTDATEVSIGTCDFNFELYSSYFNLEGNADPGADPVLQDGWIQFEATAGQMVQIDIQTEGTSASTTDLALAVYDGGCGNLNLLNYSNTGPGGNKELVEYEVTNTGTHYVRIMNLENTDGELVSVCISEIYNRDLCTALGSSPSLFLGQCNLPVNVLNNADYTSTTGTTLNFGNRDTWLKYEHTDPTITEVQLDYFAEAETDRPAIAVYDATGIDCANTNANQVATIFATGQNATSIFFPVSVGTTYYIQITDQNANVNLVGKLCMYDEAKKAEDNFFGARNFAIDNSDCGLQFNISRLFNGNGGLPDAGADQVCGGETSQLDAWAKFTTGGTLSSSQIVVEYNNDNQDPSEANNVALTVYEAPNIISQVAVLNTDISTNCADIRTVFNEDVTLTGISVANGDPIDPSPSIESSCGGAYGGETPIGDLWVTYTATVNTPIAVYFEGEDAVQNNLALAIYDNTCTTVLACADTRNEPQIASVNFIPTVGVTYKIRIVNLSSFSGFFQADLNGFLGIYNGLSQFNEVACVDNIGEGTESLTISGAALKVNTTYLIRVANINRDLENPGATATTTTGSLCIRDGQVNADDICSTARPLVVGDCNIQFNLVDANLQVDQPGAGTLYPATSCLGGKTIRSEAWASFTATASVTTVEYAQLSSNGSDASIAVYRGSCGELIPLGTCSNYYEDSVGPIAGLESISINTLVGVKYYVQILNVGSADMQGKLCIFNTVERDVCDDEDLITLSPDACNIRFNVPATFNLTGADYLSSFPDVSGDLPEENRNTCGASDIDYSATYPDARDSWVRIVGSGGLMTIQYQNINDLSDPSDPKLILYTANVGPGPVDCGIGINGAGNPENQEACANSFGTGQQTESLTFQSEAGKLYILRLIDLTLGEMQGSLCVFSGGEAPFDCADATEIDITADVGDPVDIGECNVQFNVLSSNPACDTGTFPAQCSGGGANDLNINVGGPAFTSASGKNWVSDISYAQGGNTFVNNDCVIGYAGVPAPDPNDEEMYRSMRFGTNVEYEIPVVTGAQYDLSLHFAELFYSADDERVIRVEVEGILEFPDPNAIPFQGYDIHAATGGQCVGTYIILANMEDLNNDGKLSIRIARQPGQGSDNRGVLSGITLSPVGAISTSCENEVWAKFTTNSSFLPLPNDILTVQYDNTNSSSINSTDVSLEVYRGDNCGALTLVGCSDKIVGNGPNTSEGIEELSFSVDDVNGGETYYIRILNKDPALSAFGKICIFYGQSIARPNCAETLDYGDITGVWQNFEVLSEWTDTNPQSTIEEPPCVVPGGSDPAAPDPPIVSNGWVRFEIPASSTIDAVTVQYDNAEFASSNENSENAALAIYQLNPASGTDHESLFGYDPINPASDNCTLANLVLLDCVNSVWRGTESLTIAGLSPGTTYYIRVMNIKNIGKDMPGRIRVFEFIECELGDELVVDGTFEGWGGIDVSSNDPAINPPPTDGTGDWLQYMDEWVYSPLANNPEIEDYRQDEFSADLDRHIDSYSRFASNYGYLIDRQSNSGTQDTFRPLRTKSGEFNTEGRYAVSQQAFTRKGGGFSGSDFYGYGNGYTGFGGHEYKDYCETGAPQENSEACDGFGTLQAERPALVPYTADANFMAVNGWWKQNGEQNPGKVWCQTIDLTDIKTANGEDPSDPNTLLPGYYVFSAWFQNLNADESDLDIPFLRITACDMENPSLPEDIGDANVVVPGATGNTQNFDSVLPGVTYTPSTGNPNNLTYHFPEPPEDGDMRAAPLGFTYGAVQPCNLPNESANRRLKVLGSDFLIPESPDQWMVARCIYRAPANAFQFNICIENLSLTKNGNDVGIDDISVRKCNTNNPEALDALLQGDACELADEPNALGIPLAVRMLDFSGKLLGRDVGLSWLTILEKNTSHFEVQRSLDGNEFFPIGEIDAKGESQELSSYTFMDINIPEGHSFLYYRLRIVDTRGKSRLSGLIRINIAQINQLDLNLYPNPINSGENVNLSFRGSYGSAEITLTDLMGTPMQQRLIKTQEGRNEVSLSTQNMAPGLYIIKVQHGTKRESKKLMIKN